MLVWMKNGTPSKLSRLERLHPLPVGVGETIKKLNAATPNRSFIMGWLGGQSEKLGDFDISPKNNKENVLYYSTIFTKLHNQSCVDLWPQEEVLNF